jgi:hypothetical protein
MAANQKSRHRFADATRFFGLQLASTGPVPKKKRTMAMLIDQSELAGLGFTGFEMRQESGIRPPHRGTHAPNVVGLPGTSAKRKFVSQDGPTELAIRVTPYSSEEAAIASVKQAEVVQNPAKRIKVTHLQIFEDFKIDGLETVFAREASLKVGTVNHRIRMIQSNVGSILFVIQLDSRGEHWNWEMVSQIAIAQVGKLRNTGDALDNFS